jgi:ABC-type branched-subunit amino acid transport system ATPase component
MTAAAPLLSIRNIAKSYGAVKAVDGVSLDVTTGEICGVIGPNGSGKSTLFDCVTGLQAADAGAVQLDGTDILGWPINRIAREGGLLRSFQRTVVFETATPEENLVIAGQMFRFPGILSTFSIGPASRRRIAQLRDDARAMLEMIGLSHVADLPAGKLSGGQQKLLQFGSMLISRPKLILLDEPLAGINPKLIESVVAAIRRANAELGVTFVIIEHNIDVVMSLCRRVVVLDQGAVLADDVPAAVVANKRVVEAYLGG